MKAQYDAEKFKSLYREYTEESKEELLGEVLLSLEGLINSVVYSKFSSTYKGVQQEDLKQEAFLYLLTFLKDRSVDLQQNYTSFLYRCIYHYLVSYCRKRDETHLSYEDELGINLEEIIDPKTVRNYHTKEALMFVKNELYQLHEYFRIEEGKDVCKFICHYYVGKKGMPPLELVQEKFLKISGVNSIYVIAIAMVRSRVWELRQLLGREARFPLLRS